MRSPAREDARPGAWRQVAATPLAAECTAVRPDAKPGANASVVPAMASTVAPARATACVRMLSVRRKRRVN